MLGATAMLSTALAQGRLSTVVTNVGVMAQVLASATDACAGVDCGLAGTCFQGNCTCWVASGYSGARCEVRKHSCSAVGYAASGWVHGHPLAAIRPPRAQTTQHMYCSQHIRTQHTRVTNRI